MTDVLKARPGNRTYLGATVRDDGVNFAVASTVAESVDVCLFAADGTETRFELDEYDAGVWHGVVPDIQAGQAYGFRVSGPFEPARGLRCNPSKLLLDPYARAIVGPVRFNEALRGDNDIDSAPFVPR